jgi:hypothetical protein
MPPEKIMRCIVFAPFLLLALAACGGGKPAPAVPATAAPQEAISRIGDVTIRATALPSTTLAPDVASQYGIVRDERTVMLLIGVRQGPEGQEIALPATITATVTNLSGQRQPIALRELRSGDPSTGSGQALLDYVGTVETSLPDTLRFDVTIVRQGGATSTMQFSRDFYPQ